MLASCLSRKQVFERKRRRNLNTAREGDIGPTRNDPEIGDHVWVTRDGQHPSFRYGQLVFIEEISVGAHLFLIRDFHANDSAVVGSVAIAAFTQFRDFYSDWPTFRQRVESMGSLSETGEIVVATVMDEVVGAVAYIGPGKQKQDFFRQEWPIMRLLVVNPTVRGLGVGKALAEECIQRAVRDGATVFALHTSPIMKVALPMYLRMGFEYVCDAPPIFGVPYSVYLKSLGEASTT